VVTVIPKYIILHHSLTKDSGTVSWGAIRGYHVGVLGWRDIGYHVGVERIRDDYEILLGRMLNVPGAHTRGMNHVSIGVCFMGNFDLAPPSPELWEKGITVVKWIREVFSIPINHVQGHRDYASYKSCPGKKFNVSQFKKDLLL